MIETLLKDFGLDKTKLLTGCSERALYRKQAQARKGEEYFTELEVKAITHTLDLEAECELLHREIETLSQQLKEAQSKAMALPLYDLIVRGAAIRETYLSEQADHWFKQQCELVQQDGRELLPLHKLR